MGDEVTLARSPCCAQVLVHGLGFRVHGWVSRGVKHRVVAPTCPGGDLLERKAWRATIEIVGAGGLPMPDWAVSFWRRVVIHRVASVKLVTQLEQVCAFENISAPATALHGISRLLAVARGHSSASAARLASL